jgi:hypothetical protein
LVEHFGRLVERLGLAFADTSGGAVVISAGGQRQQHQGRGKNSHRAMIARFLKRKRRALRDATPAFQT